MPYRVSICSSNFAPFVPVDSSLRLHCSQSVAGVTVWPTLTTAKMRVKGARPGEERSPSAPTNGRINVTESLIDVPERLSGKTVDRECSDDSVKKLLSMDPPVINFSACTPSRLQSRRLRIVNASGTPVRFCILLPESGAFRISFEKKSYLAPGMSQEVTIHFVPTAWRVYKSSLRVVSVPMRIPDPCGTSATNAPPPYTLQHVPLSSFPELRNMRLPRLLNFGVVPLGITERKTLKLSNPHQSSFHFKVNIITANPAFSVEPVSGDVSATSTQELTISYTPQVRATAFFAIEIHVADFKSKACRVEAIGTCWEAPSHSTEQRAVEDDSVINPPRCCPCMTVPRSEEPARPRLQPERRCDPGWLVEKSDYADGVVCSRTGKTQKIAEATGHTECFLRCSTSSDYVRDTFAKVEHVGSNAGAKSAEVSLEHLDRVCQFSRRWEAMLRSECSKTHRSTILGEAPTTDLRRQKLLSKLHYEALDLLKKQSERDFNRKLSAVSREAVVVPSQWIPRRGHTSTNRTEVPSTNFFILRKDSAEKFALIVTTLIKKLRALRRLRTLQKTLKLRQTTATSDSDVAGVVSRRFEKFAGDTVISREEEPLKELTVPLVSPQRTTYQELFQVAWTKSSIPPALLVKSKIEVADVFKSLDNYDYMSPLPPLDYEIMHLPDVEAPDPAWHLEPTDPRLLHALLGHTESLSGDRGLGHPPQADHKLPPIVFGRPLVNAAHFVAPSTIEFRPVIPLPKDVETDLGYCFKKVRPENALKDRPRLSLPCVGDTAVNSTQKAPSTEASEESLLAEVCGTSATFGRQPPFASSPYFGGTVERIAWDPPSVDKMSDTDSDSHERSIETPVPPFDTYIQSEPGDEQACGTTEAITQGELYDSKREEFIEAAAALSESWGRRTTEMLNRLHEINMNLPLELRMKIP